MERLGKRAMTNSLSGTDTAFGLGNFLIFGLWADFYRATL